MAAISINSSEEEVVKSRKLYTGIGEFKIILVNPTLQELNDNDIMIQTEPSYEVDFGDGPLTKIVLWARNEFTTVPVEFLITPGPWLSKTGKFKWYNAIGQNSWAKESEPDVIDESGLPDWYQDPETSYKIPKGGDTLTEFVRAWANVETDGNIKLEKINDIATGDVTELLELLKLLVNNRLRLLCYVRDGKYQAVYTRHFGRIKPKRDDWFTTAMLEDYGAVKGEYTIKWQEYDPAAIVADAAAGDALGDPEADEDYSLDAVDDDPLGDDPLDDTVM